MSVAMTGVIQGKSSELDPKNYSFGKGFGSISFDS